VERRRSCYLLIHECSGLSRTAVQEFLVHDLGEYREGFARLGVRRPLIGKIVNTLPAKGQHVKPGPTRNLSPDPDDNQICDCAEHGDAHFTVTLNPKDFPQASLRAKIIGPGDPARSAHKNSASEFMKRVTCTLVQNPPSSNYKELWVGASEPEPPSQWNDSFVRAGLQLRFEVPVHRYIIL